MSLEEKLAALTEAVEANTNAQLAVQQALLELGNGRTAPAAEQTEKAPAKRAPKPAAEAPADDAPSFDDVKKAVLKVASRSREQCVDLLARYGAKRVTDLKVAQYGDILDVANRLLKGAA